MPARSEELQTLASNLYGQNYARERGLMANAASQALPLGQNDFADINAQIDALNLPLDTLINRIGALAPAAGGTAVSSQPIQGRSPLGGALGGLSAGAGIASAITPAGAAMGPLGWGAMGLGGLLGLLG
jgi:hypothetical protein